MTRHQKLIDIVQRVDVKHAVTVGDWQHQLQLLQEAAELCKAQLQALRELNHRYKASKEGK